ncbi:DNA-binding protein HU [candidate division WWE3 bacterium CG10_big_fil_rev_8_21_14_0_10_32_10]|uniref:DNA-binding protein HU n=1 Tax=candidate division WWE3 bacterium CG10_big_fil_rev_8_21_14_0_10_32_10 TaxID=1975090 RepID=A0A2H0RAS2_UNCKA|nr:MAG: DNA-binding protein HU [candidate division WWE3 bacterium CG10_big_fil_rev_8_21_14_0_10_32_10]
MATKTELIEMVAKKAGVTKAESQRVVDAVIESITEALERGEKVTVTGFGTYEVRQRAARMGRNPQTGETIQIPAQRTPAFRAGKSLKDAVK